MAQTLIALYAILCGRISVVFDITDRSIVSQNQGEQIEWITPKEAAKIMDVALPTVHRLCREGVIHCERFGEKLWKINKASAEAYEKTEGGRGKKVKKDKE